MLCLLVLLIGPRAKWSRCISISILLFVIGFAWNAHYAECRLKNILAEELEGKELSAEGRIIALPQSNSTGAKFAFELDYLLSGKERVSHFPKRVYLSW